MKMKMKKIKLLLIISLSLFSCKIIEKPIYIEKTVQVTKFDTVFSVRPDSVFIVKEFFRDSVIINTQYSEVIAYVKKDTLIVKLTEREIFDTLTFYDTLKVETNYNETVKPPLKDFNDLPFWIRAVLLCFLALIILYFIIPNKNSFRNWPE